MNLPLNWGWFKSHLPQSLTVCQILHIALRHYIPIYPHFTPPFLFVETTGLLVLTVTIRFKSQIHHDPPLEASNHWTPRAPDIFGLREEICHGILPWSKSRRWHSMVSSCFMGKPWDLWIKSERYRKLNDPWSESELDYRIVPWGGVRETLHWKPWFCRQNHPIKGFPINQPNELLMVSTCMIL